MGGVIKHLCLVSVPGSWHRALKTCYFLSDGGDRNVLQSFWIPWHFWVSGVLFVLMRPLWVGSWIASAWGLLSRKTKPSLQAWNLQLHYPNIQGGRGAGGWVNNWSCLWDEASIKKSLNYGTGFGELPGWSTHLGMCWEGGAAQLHRDRSSCAQDPSRPQPMYLFICTFIILLIINQ